MYQVTPKNPTIPNGTLPLRFECFVDILEEHLADFGPHLDVPPRTSEGEVILSFRLGKGANALELDLMARPWCAKRSCVWFSLCSTDTPQTHLIARHS